MRYLRRVLQILPSVFGGPGGFSRVFMYTRCSNEAAMDSNANTILSSRSATFSTGFGSSMSRILSPGPGKNNLSLYAALAGGKQ